MPVMPAFENSQLLNPSGFVTRMTLMYQLESFVKGKGSILAFIESACKVEKNVAREIFDKHMVVCGLRQYDVWPDNTVRAEQLYVHSKAMIVDDEIAIIGSANINDRSMLGERDSEAAIYVEDPKFAKSLRRELWGEHFGTLDPALNDPSSNACFDMWRSTAISNGEIYRKFFGVVPCNEVKTRKDFELRMQQNTMRIVSLNDPQVRDQLSNLKGRIVAFQFGFLEHEDNLSEPMPTSAALCPREIFC
jgi:phospholipase D1/2